MEFTFEFGSLCFSSDRPGAHATLLAPHGQNPPLFNDRCSFNDFAGKYKWVFFALPMPLAEGDKMTFATAEYDVTCVFEGGGFRILPDGEGQAVEREEGTGRPLKVKVKVNKMEDPVKTVEDRRVLP